ncbi:hypothetical protein niasHS_005904 [Heterodera schachtii]|uniref:CAP-Gly domain-containing protein n=1 Tax=Heterodera schachtii TaxID=97005 RepID=A0ABD2JRY0_HETSC
MALVEFKVKLELVVGIYSADMKLELRSHEGKFISELIGDDRTLEELGVRDQCIVNVCDTNETRNDNSTNDPNAFYVIPEERYTNRKDTARKWKQQLMTTATTTDVERSEQQVPNKIRPGKRCLVQLRDQPPRKAQIAFVGPTHFGENPGTTQWVGVIYDEATGKNDGSLDGHRYFHCEPSHGGFVQIRAIVNVLDDVEQAANDKDQTQHQTEIEEI